MTVVWLLQLSVQQLIQSVKSANENENEKKKKNFSQRGAASKDISNAKSLRDSLRYDRMRVVLHQCASIMEPLLILSVSDNLTQKCCRACNAGKTL